VPSLGGGTGKPVAEGLRPLLHRRKNERDAHSEHRSKKVKISPRGEISNVGTRLDILEERRGAFRRWKTSVRQAESGLDE